MERPATASSWIRRNSFKLWRTYLRRGRKQMHAFLRRPGRWHGREKTSAGPQNEPQCTRHIVGGVGGLDRGVTYTRVVSHKLNNQPVPSQDKGNVSNGLGKFYTKSEINYLINLDNLGVNFRLQTIRSSGSNTCHSFHTKEISSPLLLLSI